MMRPSKLWVAAVLGMIVLGGGLAGCAAMKGESEKAAGPSLYRRLGGREGIRGVVDEFVANVVADPRVRGRFTALKPGDVEKLKTNLSDQICEATGGPCSYLGRDMKTVHTGMGITEEEWNATVEALVKALDKKGAGAKEKQELLALLGPMKGDIVGR